MGMEGMFRKLREFRRDENEKHEFPEAADLAEKAAKGAGASAVGLGLILGTPAAAEAAPARSASIESTLSDFERTEATFSEHDIEQLALNVEMEAANQPVEGQLAVAQVTIASALAPHAYISPDGTIAGAVWKKNRFSWTRSTTKDAALPQSPSYQNLLTTLGFALEGKTKHEALAALSAITGLPHDTLYYKRTDWTASSDDPRKRLSPAAAAMFDSLSFVGTIGEHSFYADRRGNK